MTLTLLYSPSIGNNILIGVQPKPIRRFYQKLHPELPAIVSQCSLSLYPFFDFALRRNNSLSHDKELLPIGQETNLPKNINVLGQMNARLWKSVNVLGQTTSQTCKYVNVLGQMTSRLSEYVNVLWQTSSRSCQYVKSFYLIKLKETLHL